MIVELIHKIYMYVKLNKINRYVCRVMYLHMNIRMCCNNYSSHVCQQHVCDTKDYVLNNKFAACAQDVYP